MKMKALNKKNKNIIKAIIFDMNGVIVDDEPLHREAFQNVFRDLGFTLTNIEYEEIFAGRTDKDGFELAFSNMNISPNISECIQKKSCYYRSLAKNNLRPFPGIIDFINETYGDYQLALASGSFLEEIDIVLSTLDIKEKFKIIVGCEDVVKGKPNPEIYLLTSQRLNIPPRNCLVIEDTKSGIEAAKSAGMICLAVTNTCSKDNLIMADFVIDSFNCFKLRDILD